MPALRSKNKLLTAKIETVENEYSTPTAALNAIAVENLQIKPRQNQTQTDDHTGTLDGSSPIPSGTMMDITFTLNVKGSGTAGTVPEWGVLFRACAHAEIIRATAFPASPELATGGTATTIDLGTSAASTADLYVGEPIQIDSDEITHISSYTAAKEATVTDTADTPHSSSTNYQILPNVTYVPASIDIPSLSLGVYEDGLLTKITGVRGTVTPDKNAGASDKVNFTLMGVFLSETDVPVPAATFDAGTPPTWRNGSMTIDAQKIGASTLSINCNNSSTYPPNPNEQEGVDAAVITARSITGSLDVNRTLVATRNLMDSFRTGSSHVIHGRSGSVAGNRLATTIPQAQITDLTGGDRDGIATHEMQFHCGGDDAGYVYCVY